MPLIIQRLVCLRDDVVVLLVGRHIPDVVRDDRILRIRLVDQAVRCLDEAVLVDLCIACQRVDQADVRAFRCLDGAHAAVVCIVNVADLESGALSGEAARTQCGESALVRQLGQRVVLVHELGQLGTSEELLDRGRHRLDVDQRLRRRLVLVHGVHAFPHDSLHTGETDAVLILQKLSDRTDTAVAQMVDVIRVADAVLQVEKIVHGGKNVLLEDVLWDQRMQVLAQRLFEGFFIQIEVENALQLRIIDHLTDAGL